MFASEASDPGSIPGWARLFFARTVFDLEHEIEIDFYMIDILFLSLLKFCTMQCDSVKLNENLRLASSFYGH